MENMNGLRILGILIVLKVIIRCKIKSKSKGSLDDSLMRQSKAKRLLKGASTEIGTIITRNFRR